MGPVCLCLFCFATRFPSLLLAHVNASVVSLASHLRRLQLPSAGSFSDRSAFPTAEVFVQRSSCVACKATVVFLPYSAYCAPFVSPQAFLMSTVVPLKSLHDGMHQVEVQVKVIRLWSKPNASTVYFLLLDKEGTAIQGSVSVKDHRRVYAHFAEGSLCQLSGFTIVPAENAFRACPHPFALSLTSQTIARSLLDPTIQIRPYYFRLRELVDVGIAVTATNEIIDVVVRIVGFGPVQTLRTKYGPARFGTLYIANEREFGLDVALWGAFVDQFDIAALAAKSASAPVVVACNSLQLRSYKDRFSLKTFIGTRFHFDETLPEVIAFRSRLPPCLPPIFTNLADAPPALQLGGPAVVAPPPPQKVTLEELAVTPDHIQEVIYECVAEIVDVLMQIDWLYYACPSCFRKLADPDKRPICDVSTCKLFKERVVVLPWFRFTVHVKDHTAMSRFVLLGKQAELVVGP